MIVKDKLEKREAKRLKAAVALNMCMVSLSQIVDYNDINILKMEYDAILNNISIENFPKDEALLDALKKILDTCHFYILHEKDKELLKEKQELRLKSALSNALKGGNIFAVVGSMNPYAIAAGVAIAVGVAAVNYKTQKKKAEFENKAEEWELQKSALEQLHNLRSTLFTTAWRLADSYDFEPDWRLSEKQISLYDEILSDPDAFSRYYRLQSISSKFEAYPPFFYYMGHAALECAIEEESMNKNQQTRCSKKMRSNAKEALGKFSELYSGCHLLREDLLASSAFLDYCEFLKNDRPKLFDQVKQAHELAGWDLPTLQNCAFRYLSLTCDDNGEKLHDAVSCESEKRAVSILELLVHENHNMSINSRLLSKLYIESDRSDDYKILDRMISSRFPYFKYRHILPWGKDYQLEISHFIKNSSALNNFFFDYFRSELYTMFSELLLSFRTTEHDGNTVAIKQYFENHSIDREELFCRLYQLVLSLPEEVHIPVSDFFDNNRALLNSKMEGFFNGLENMKKNCSESYWFFWNRPKDLSPGQDDKVHVNDRNDYEKCKEEFYNEFKNITGVFANAVSQFFGQYVRKIDSSSELENVMQCLDQWTMRISENRKNLCKKGITLEATHSSKGVEK